MAKSADSYQQMYTQVEQIIHAIEADAMDLDEIVREVEKGHKLIAKMLHRLQESKNTIDRCKQELDSTVNVSALAEDNNPPDAQVGDENCM